jgi:hypothetical protein
VLREAVSVSWTLCGHEDVMSLTTLRLLGALLHEEGKLVEAQKLFRLVVDKTADMPLVSSDGASAKRRGTSVGPVGGRLLYGSAKSTPQTSSPSSSGNSSPQQSLRTLQGSHARALHAVALLDTQAASLTHARDTGSTDHGSSANGRDTGAGEGAAATAAASHNTLPIDAANGLALLLLEMGQIAEAVEASVHAASALSPASTLLCPGTTPHSCSLCP